MTNLCRQCKKPIDRRTLKAGGEVCFSCCTRDPDICAVCTGALDNDPAISGAVTLELKKNSRTICGECVHRIKIRHDQPLPRGGACLSPDVCVPCLRGVLDLLIRTYNARGEFIACITPPHWEAAKPQDLKPGKCLYAWKEAIRIFDGKIR